MTIFLAEDQLDPAILTRLLFEKWPDGRVCRSVIREAKLPSLVKLTLNRFNRRFEQMQIRIINRHQDRNQWLPPQVPKITLKRDRIDRVKPRHPITVTGRDAPIVQHLFPGRRRVHEQTSKVRGEFLESEMALKSSSRARSQLRGELPIGDASLDGARQSFRSPRAARADRSFRPAATLLSPRHQR